MFPSPSQCSGKVKVNMTFSSPASRGAKKTNTGDTSKGAAQTIAKCEKRQPRKKTYRGNYNNDQFDHLPQCATKALASAPT